MLTGTPLTAHEFGQYVGGRREDEGVYQVRVLAAEGGGCTAPCKVSATQEQQNSLLPEITTIHNLSKC